MSFLQFLEIMKILLDLGIPRIFDIYFPFVSISDTVLSL